MPEPTPDLGMREQAKASPNPPDLRTLAAEAVRELRGRYGPLGDGSLRSGGAGEIADAVLAAVLPKVADYLARRAHAVPWSDPAFRRGIQYAASVVRSLAETHPATGPGSTQPDESGSVVAQEAPDAAPAAVDLMAALRASLEQARASRGDKAATDG